MSVVAEDADPGPGPVHEAELGELDALDALRHRADGLDVDEATGPAEVEDVLDDLGGVGDGTRVRHGEDGREAPGRRGGRAARDRLGVLPSRLAQMGVDVDETGKQGEAVGVEDLGVRRRVDPAHLGDDAVADEDVARLTGREVGGIPGGSADQEGVAHAATSVPSPVTAGSSAPARRW